MYIPGMYIYGLRKNESMKYKLIRSKRRTLCLEIRNATLVVRAPFLYPEFKIDQFVKTKEKWILKHIKKVKKQFQKKPNEIYLDGKKYSFEIVFSEKESVKIAGSRIIVMAKNRECVEEQIKNYFKLKTKERIEVLLGRYADVIGRNYDNQIIYKFFKSKWGSCSARNSLSFNAALSMAPPEIVEYVFIHEIVHIKVKNHGRDFWQRVSRIDPDYKTHRHWLSQNRDMLKI